jgi:hypothetical protein
MGKIRRHSNSNRHLTLGAGLIVFVWIASLTITHAEKNQQEAIDAAIAVTGFDRLPDISISARHEVLAQDNTPVLGIEIENRPIWRITFENIKLRFSNRQGEGFLNPYIHAFDVLVDGENGKVLKIVSPWPPEVTPEERAPAERERVEREKDEMNYEEQRFETVPMNEKYWPKVTFLQALEVANRGPGPVLSMAKQIEGLYFLYSSTRLLGRTENTIFQCPFGKPCPTWLINLYGIQFRSYYTSFYHTVHAMTGQGMASGAPAK